LLVIPVGNLRLSFEELSRAQPFRVIPQTCFFIISQRSFLSSRSIFLVISQRFGHLAVFLSSRSEAERSVLGATTNADSSAALRNDNQFRYG
jgi:hypothetical protein